VKDTTMADTESDGTAPSPLQVFGNRMITRAYELEDIHIKPGTGRSVEAYATVFDTEAEIVDTEGHYLEVNDPHAFDKHLQRMGGVFRVGVFYNHGKTLHGKSSEAGSVPLGRPELIRADARGLLTVTEYNKTQLADDILEGIKSGSISAQSYTGPVFKSTPALSRSQRRRGGYQPNPDGTLQTVRRMELGIFEYGPTPIPAYEDAAIVGVRAQQYFSDEDQDDAPDESDPAPATVEADPFRRRLHAAMRARGL
jgi:phage head maturation protease